MNDAQIQRAANDADGSSGWSPEVRWLAAEMLRLRRTVENYEETSARTRARAERAEADVQQCQEVYAAAREVVRSAVDPGPDRTVSVAVARVALARLAKAVGL